MNEEQLTTAVASNAGARSDSCRDCWRLKLGALLVQEEQEAQRAHKKVKRKKR